MTTAERIKEIRERAEKATVGPWVTVSCSHGGRILTRGDTNVGRKERHPQTYIQIVPREDAHFIAHAREDIPWLLERVEELEKEVEEAWSVAEER